MRLTSARFALGLLVLVAGAWCEACSDWPGIRKDGTDGGDGHAVPNERGTCSGTPLPCSTLNTAECGSTPGCVDNGVCGGTATDVGLACSTESSAQGCNSIAGCFWSTNCTGTPLATCSAFTEDACLQAKGCVFTPDGVAGSGGSANATTCQTFGEVCRSSLDCDCSMGCISLCSGCAQRCGFACASDTNCASTAAALGFSAPFCVKVGTPTPPFSGICSQSR